MADNSAQNGTDLIADDDITGGGVAAGAKVQRIKVGYGTDGNYADVTPALPLPVTGVDLATTGTAITTQNLVPAGTATAASAVTSPVLAGASMMTVQVTGAWTAVGGLSVQGTVNGTVWVTLGPATGGTVLTNAATSAATGVIPSAAQGIWQVSVAGYTQLRVTALGVVTGTATVALNASAGAGETDVVSIGSPTGKGSGIFATVNPFGALQIGMEPTTVIRDPFDGVTLDTNRWTAAGTVPPTQPGTGAVLVNPSTTASASSSLVSQATPQPTGLSIFYSAITLEVTTIATGNHRFWGLGTQPGTWTALLPLQDAIGFELDPSGVLRASIWSAGTRIFTQALTVPVDGLPHTYGFLYRPLGTFFFIDSLEIPVTPLVTAIPATQTLPVRVHSINGTSTTTGTPTLAAAALSQLDSARNAQNISDGAYPWRRATVGAGGGLWTREQPSSAIAAPTSWTVSATAATSVIPADPTRRFITLQSMSTANVFMRHDGSAPTTAQGGWHVQLPAGGYMEVPERKVPFAISFIGSAANGYVEIETSSAA